MQITPNIQLLALVGLALSTWSQVERAMTELFSVISGMDRKRAAILFDGIINFETRLSILDRMMALEPVDEMEAETWTRLSKRLGRFYKKRHELAHFALGCNDKGEWTVSPFLTFETIIFNEDQRKHLTTAVVSERNGKFVELALTIDWFTAQAVRRRPQSGIGLERQISEPPLVARLRELAAQTLEDNRRRASQPGPG